jgi:ATP-dependent protease ClpP protease subunit
MGKIMSAGVLLLAAGDERIAYPNTRFMFHEASYDVEYQKHTVIKSEVAAVEEEDRAFLQCLAAVSNKTALEWGKITHGRPDKYFDVTQAKEYGIIDKVMGD